MLFACTQLAQVASSSTGGEGGDINSGAMQPHYWSPDTRRQGGRGGHTDTGDHSGSGRMGEPSFGVAAVTENNGVIGGVDGLAGNHAGRLVDDPSIAGGAVAQDGGGMAAALPTTQAPNSGARRRVRFEDDIA